MLSGTYLLSSVKFLASDKIITGKQGAECALGFRISALIDASRPSRHALRPRTSLHEAQLSNTVVLTALLADLLVRHTARSFAVVKRDGSVVILNNSNRNSSNNDNTSSNNRKNSNSSNSSNSCNSGSVTMTSAGPTCCVFRDVYI